MASDQEIIRELWERSSNEEIVQALFICPEEYSPEALEILTGVAQRRGLERPEAALLDRLRAERQVAEAASDRGKPLVVCDKSLVCHACGHDRFRQRSGLPESALAGLLGLESDRPLRCAICTRCGYVHWFA